MVNVLAIPVVVGRKTEQERFAGATTTWSTEAMMRDGKALQMGTSHELGQGFAQAFDISFLDQAGQKSFVWQTSWGASTRLMGALIMAHGDDAGLRLPPRLAPVQVVVLAVRTEEGAGEAAAQLAASLKTAGIRVELDARTELAFGRRAVGWELKGVPVRLEVGPRDLANGTVVLCRRDDASKTPVRLNEAGKEVAKVLEAAQASLMAEAGKMRSDRTIEVSRLEGRRRGHPVRFRRGPGRLADRRRRQRRGAAQCGRGQRAGITAAGRFPALPRRGHRRPGGRGGPGLLSARDGPSSSQKGASGVSQSMSCSVTSSTVPVVAVVM